MLFLFLLFSSWTRLTFCANSLKFIILPCIMSYVITPPPLCSSILRLISIRFLHSCRALLPGSKLTFLCFQRSQNLSQSFLSISSIFPDYPWLETFWLDYCIIAVSYTHLDVYKRQVYVFMYMCCCIFGSQRTWGYTN